MKKVIYAFVTVFVFSACIAVYAQENMPAELTPLSPPVEVNFTQLAEYERLHPVKDSQRYIEQGEDMEEMEDARPKPRRVTGGDPVFNIDLYRPKSNQRVSAVSPAPQISFNGTMDNGTSIPPDIGGAAGPVYLMQTTNQSFDIRTKTGSLISSVSRTTFFASTGGSGFFDPRVVYDPNYGRYIICMAGDIAGGRGGVFLAVSQTNDPRGSWYIYSHDGTGNTSDLYDFPSLGYNTNWVVITANVFLSGGGVRTKVSVFNRANVYSGTVGTVTTFTDANVFTLCPAQTQDISQQTLYLVANNVGNYNGYGYMQFFKITGAANAPAYSYINSIGIDKPWSETAIGGLQKGTANTIDIGDTRVGCGAIFINGSLWFSHTVFLPVTTPTHSAVDWWQVDPANLAVQQFGRVEDVTAAIDYYYPFISVNSLGDALLGYCQSGTNHFASTSYSFHANTDAAGVMQDTYIAKAGAASYFKTFGSGRNRYGDYTGASVDPTNNSFWYFGEWASTGNLWGSFIANVLSSTNTPCIAPSGLTATAITDNSATLSWSSIANALSYNVRYRKVGTTTWTTVNSLTNSYTAAGLTGSTNYEWQVQTVCSGGSSSFAASVTFLTLITCNVALPVVTPASICTGKSVVLNATGVDSLFWFSVPSSGTVMAKGSSFTTPVLNANTTYYVESNVFPAIQHVGPANNSIGAGSIFTNTVTYHDLIFDCYAACKLVSVLVYAQGVSNRTITLIDGSGNTLKSKLVSVPDGASRITLNWDLPVGNNLELGMTGNVFLYRNSAGAVFPYTLPNILSIKGTNAAGSPGYYYYFYDWQIIGPACKSGRVALPVTVNDPAAAFGYTVNGGSVIFDDQSSGATSWQWDFGDGSSTSTQQNPVHAYNNTGTFPVRQIACSGNCCDTIYQNVQILNVGIAELNADGVVKIFPNPVSETMQVTLGNLLQGKVCLMILTNSIGQTVLEKQLTIDEVAKGYTLSTSSFSRGIYTLTIESNQQRYRQMVIKN